jgi:hypothetical protein
MPDAVNEIVDFVMLLQDLIMERCGDAGQMRQELPQCIDDAMEMLDVAKYDKLAIGKIQGMLLYFFRQDSQ